MASLFCAMSLGLVSCSDSDDKVTASRVIEEVEIYHSSSVITPSYEYLGVVRPKYEGTKIMGVSVDNPSIDVNYEYENEVKYTVYYHDGKEYVRDQVEITLMEGRAVSGRSSQMGMMMFGYSGNRLSGVNVMNNASSYSLIYEWKNSSLASIKSGGTTLAAYTASSVLNNYNIDINLLPALVAGNKKELSTLNVFSQFIGVLGNKSMYLLEDTRCEYDYAFDKNGRLSVLTFNQDMRASSLYVDGAYMLKIKYK